MVPAEALTIHKSQGQTYDKVCIDFSKNYRVSKPLLYVAFSRVRHLNDLYIIGNLSILNLKTDKILKQEIIRLKSEKLLSLSYINEIPGNAKIIIYYNSCSLKQNFKYILCDNWYQQADILIFSETRIKMNNNNIQINGYKIAFMSEIDSPTLPRGIICFVKLNIPFQIVKTIRKTEMISDYQHHRDLFHICLKDLDIISGYKSPRTTNQMFIKHLTELIKETKNKQKIIIGDFNIDCYYDNSFLEIYLSNYNFKRGINTKISTTKYNTQIIDVIFVSKGIKKISPGVYETFFSDHKPVFIGLNVDKNTESISSFNKTKSNLCANHSNMMDSIVIKKEFLNNNSLSLENMPPLKKERLSIDLKEQFLSTSSYLKIQEINKSNESQISSMQENSIICINDTANLLKHNLSFKKNTITGRCKR